MLCAHVSLVSGTAGSWAPMICGHLLICWQSDLCASTCTWAGAPCHPGKQKLSLMRRLVIRHITWPIILTGNLFTCDQTLLPSSVSFCIPIPPQSTLIPQLAPHPCRQSVTWSGEPLLLSHLVDLLPGLWADCSPALGLGQSAPCAWVRLLGSLHLSSLSAFCLWRLAFNHVTYNRCEQSVPP